MWQAGQKFRENNKSCDRQVKVHTWPCDWWMTVPPTAGHHPKSSGLSYHSGQADAATVWPNVPLTAVFCVPSLATRSSPTGHHGSPSWLQKERWPLVEWSVSNVSWLARDWGTLGQQRFGHYNVYWLLYVFLFKNSFMMCFDLFFSFIDYVQHVATSFII